MVWKSARAVGAAVVRTAIFLLLERRGLAGDLRGVVAEEVGEGPRVATGEGERPGGGQAHQADGRPARPCARLRGHP